MALPVLGREACSLHLALSVNTVGQFSGKRQHFGGCLRLVHVPATAPGCSHCARRPKSPAGRWRHELPLLPVLILERTAPGWDLSSLPDSRVNVGVYWVCPNPHPPAWLPSSAKDFWSKLPHFSCLPTEVLGGKALPSGLCGCRVSSIPGAGGSLQAGAPSHCLVLSNWARRSTGK